MTVRWIISLLTLAMCTGFMLSACGEPPDQRIMDAEDAIKKAAAAGADAESPKLLDQARSLVQEAKMLGEQGHNKDARNKAELAIIRAEKAEKNALRLSSAHHEEGATGEEKTETKEEGGE
jgi:hypothetical protein